MMRRLLLPLVCLSSLFVGVALRAAEDKPADPWLDALSPLLSNHYQTAGDLVLTWVRPLPATAPVSATLSLVTVPTALSSQMLVGVRATDSAGRTSEHTVILRVELWRDGWTSREPSVSGDPVTPSRLEIRRFDALRDRDALAADSTATDDLDFARNVPAGRLLVWRDVLRRPLVRRGQPVEVSATDGLLTVTLRGIAMQDAARGESVRVRNPDTKKEFTALVTSEARAAVRF